MKTLINKNEEIILDNLFLDQMFGEHIVNLSHDYFTNHLITYLGNKRSLLPFLNKYILEIKKKLNKDKLISLDGFAGSGVVSRLLLNYSDYLISNDIENYAYIINKSYLTSKHKINNLELSNHINYINENIDNKQDIDYFIHKNYSPKDDDKIKDGERVFYTSKNGKRIDNAKHLIYNTNIPKKYQDILMSLLLIKASINNNTSGVFKGFHKKNGIGHFGGKGENALSRIKREIILDYPILINHNCDVEVTKNDINELVKNKDIIFDIAYFDPPYNQHPYGSNYFMLNLIAGKDKMEIQDDGVSGIIKDWYKSDYNKRQIAELAMNDLIKNTKAKYILISYNNEGIIPIDNFKKILKQYGSVVLKTQEYNTYRGSRNLNGRDIKVQEMLWILEKKEYKEDGSEFVVNDKNKLKLNNKSKSKSKISSKSKIISL